IYCSKKCRHPWNGGLKGLQIAWNRDKKFPEYSGKNNPMWKGDEVGYGGIHKWIYLKRGKAKNYNCKFIDKTCKGNLEWSNISKKYYRKLYDWQILCHSHHMRFDKVMPKYRFKKGHIPWNKNLNLH
ncbi:MAG: hypothetical protein AABY22_19555, partial [Nanoarchaeota archaeon]